MCMLAVNAHRTCGDLRKGSNGHGMAIDVGTRTATAWHHPRNHDLNETTWALRLTLEILRDDVGRQQKSAINASFCAAWTHHISVGTTAYKKRDRPQQHRLSGAGFAGQCAETWTDSDPQSLNHPKVCDLQLREHYATSTIH